MRRLIAGSLAAAALTFAVAALPALAADADPTVHQIYEAARSGHLDQAQAMMNQVLRDHPDSAKAHFVQAELYAREGNAGLARSELRRAEELKPGLPDVSPQAVQALKSELGLGQPGASRFGSGTATAPHFPWGMLMIFALAIGALWMLFRRRNSVVQYPAGTIPAGGAPAAYGPSGYGPGGYGAPGSGIGGSIAGGLASGLAVGAGVVAGEEIAHHFLDGRRESGTVLPPGEDARPSNSDMGGTDFGVDDPGSWDDGGDSGGGGGDWS